MVICYNKRQQIQLLKTFETLCPDQNVLRPRPVRWRGQDWQGGLSSCQSQWAQVLVMLYPVLFWAWWTSWTTWDLVIRMKSCARREPGTSRSAVHLHALEVHQSQVCTPRSRSVHLWLPSDMVLHSFLCPSYMDSLLHPIQSKPWAIPPKVAVPGL